MKSAEAFAEVFERTLRAVAVPTDIGFLSYRDRWRLLVEMLLGHPPVVGFQRPRDFPMGSQFETATRLAEHFFVDVSRPYGEDKVESYVLYDWLFAFSLVSLHIAEALSGAERERHYRNSVAALLYEISGKLFERPASWFPEFAMRHLGFGRFERKQANKRRGRVDETIQLAQKAAIVARYDSAGEFDKGKYLSGRNEALGQGIPSLENVRLSLIRVKTAQPQAMLRLCTRDYLMRGASAWCFQSLAWLRDALLDSDRGGFQSALLLSDADVEFVLAVPGAVSHDRLTKKLQDFFDALNQQKGSIFAERFPALVPYIEKAHAKGVWLTSTLPRFRPDVVDTSLFGLATDATPYDPDYRDSREVVCPPVSRLAPGDAACSGRDGDAAIDMEPPPWYERYRGIDGQFECLGWPATVFSLVGMTYRLRVQQEMLRLTGDRTVGVPGGRKDVLEGVPGPSRDICLLKIDGNSVGKLFVETPSLKRPALSLRLTSELRHHWESGVREVQQEAAKVQQGAANGHLVIDPVYFGGDDIAVYLPYQLLPAFCNGFARSAAESKLKVKFCYVAFVYSAEQDEGSRLAQAAFRIMIGDDGHDNLLRKAKRGDSVHQAAMAIRDGKAAEDVDAVEAEVLSGHASDYLKGYTLRLS